MPESDTIDIRTLTIYVRACEEQNLTRCAEAMDLPKTTVSKAITRLESRLGLKLLERSTRKVQITEEGQVVLERARMLLTDFRSLTEDALSMATEPRGLLRVAAPPILGDYFSSQVAPAFFAEMAPGLDRPFTVLQLRRPFFSKYRSCLPGRSGRG